MAASFHNRRIAIYVPEEGVEATGDSSDDARSGPGRRVWRERMRAALGDGEGEVVWLGRASELLDPAAAVECLVLILPSVEEPELQLLTSIPKLLPKVVVTEDAARAALALRRVTIEELIEIDKLEAELAAAIGRARASGAVARAEADGGELQPERPVGGHAPATEGGMDPRGVWVRGDRRPGRRGGRLLALLCLAPLLAACSDSTGPEAEPEPEPRVPPAWLSVRVGTCGLTTERKAFCWGFNDTGRIGDGTRTDRLTPTAVSGGLTFREIDAGPLTCGVTVDDEAFCWGRSAVGDGTPGPHVVPTKVPVPSEE